MSEINRTALFGKLNKLAYKAIESATVFCKMRGNPYVELVHWFNQLLQLPDSDLHRIIKEFDIQPAQLAKDITNALERLPQGSTSISDFSPHLEESIERAWVFGSLLFGDSQIRTGHLVVGMLRTRSLYNHLQGVSKEFAKLKYDKLSDHFNALLAGSPEANLKATDGFSAQTPGEHSEAIAPAELGNKQALKQFTVNLTEQAQAGDMDPIVGRDEEIRQLVDILMRRRQNNPILTGEAGVGKTAVVEGFAQRIAQGDVPPPLQNVELRMLDVGLLQAGASMKGEFEERLKQVIEEVQASEKPIILFIDETHTLIGAGGAAGTGDAANLLKPALARGRLRTIGATTWAEYKKHIEKDPALTRRFQVVQVHEPSEEKALLMMRGVASAMEQHHQVLLLDEAIEAAVGLSHRYIPARQLPDKSVSLLDTACARVAISQHAVPAQVDDARKKIQSLNTELSIIAKEIALGSEAGERKNSATQQLQQAQQHLEILEKQWQQEQALVTQILEIRAQLRSALATVDNQAPQEESEQVNEASLSTEAQSKLKIQLQTLQQQLTQLQGEQALILPTVDKQAVASVVQSWTGIPVGKMVKNEVETVLNLAQHLEKRVIGQSHALDMIAKRVQTSRANLDNPNKPIGVFMLAGTSGVGKTETALALADTLYGGEQNIITINMSEYQEAHSVSSLKGAPPGYVGYGEGGVLTEAVRRRPHSVVLLDEVEKAHSDVHELFFQVFDKGWMEDGEGRSVDFKNTLIILTTNAGTELIENLCKDPDLMPDAEGIAKALRSPLLKVFPPALLGRLVTIPYYPLSDTMIAAIAQLQLGRIEQRIAQNYNIEFTYDEKVIQLITQRCTERESGARMIDTILTNTVLPEMSKVFLQRMVQARPVQRVDISVSKQEFIYNFA